MSAKWLLGLLVLGAFTVAPVQSMAEEKKPEAKKEEKKDDDKKAERLWPRGMKKESLTLDVWLKDVAPSAGLRSWFGHRPERWSEFLAVRGCGGSTTRRPGDPVIRRAMAGRDPLDRRTAVVFSERALRTLPRRRLRHARRSHSWRRAALQRSVCTVRNG